MIRHDDLKWLPETPAYIRPQYTNKSLNHFDDTYSAPLMSQLERVGFETPDPNLTITFNDYHDVHGKFYRYVTEISGRAAGDTPFSLHFRAQFDASEPSTTLAEVQFGEWNVNIYDDRRPLYFSVERYIGEDTSPEAIERWRGRIHVNEKLNGEIPTTIRYGHGESGPHLEYYSDLGRAYTPNDLSGELVEKRGIKETVNPVELLNDALSQISQSIIPRLSQLPEKSLQEALDSFQTAPEPLPYDGPFYFVGRRDHAQDVTSIDGPRPIQGGWRLVALGYPKLEGTPEIASDGFQYMTTTHPENGGFSHMMQFWWENATFDPHLIEVRPKAANDIYVVDAKAADHYVDEIMLANPDREELTRTEVGHFYSAVAKTMIPLSEWEGPDDDRFEYPVIIARRPLWPDEISEVRPVDIRDQIRWANEARREEQLALKNEQVSLRP